MLQKYDPAWGVPEVSILAKHFSLFRVLLLRIKPGFDMKNLLLSILLVAAFTVAASLILQRDQNETAGS
jgi:hypothetical protein